MVDANIEVQMKEQGEMRETKWLSAGYQDLLGICMRLALVDAMYRRKNRFWCWTIRLSIWMKKRWHMAMNCLEKFREYQILYFTCHASRNIENTK